MGQWLMGQRLLNNKNLGSNYLLSYFVWSNTVSFQVSSYVTSHYTTYLSSYRQEREKNEVRPTFYTFLLFGTNKSTSVPNEFKPCECVSLCFCLLLYYKIESFRGEIIHEKTEALHRMKEDRKQGN